MRSAVQARYRGSIPETPPAGVTARAWQAFRLHVGDGLTYAEVGGRLGVTSTRAWQLVGSVDHRIRSGEAANDGSDPLRTLPARVRNALRRYATQTGRSDYTDPARLTEMTDDELLGMRGLGKTGVDQLREALGSRLEPCSCCGGTGLVRVPLGSEAIAAS